MKPAIIILILISTFQLNAQKVTQTEALQAAQNWTEAKMQVKKSINLFHKAFTYKSDTTLYVFNIGEDGFIVLSADKNTYPILAYSCNGNFNFNTLPPEIQSWFEYYSEMVQNNKVRKKNKDAHKAWDETIQGAFLKSSLTNVPSLFQSTGSSSWAGWTPYHNQAPETPPQYNRGTNGCVPGRMAELMKYYRHPRIGSGSKTYSYDGITITENFNRIFEYEEMPYQLTYCGNGHPTCNDGSFDIIPGITQKNIDQIGWLQYLAGVSVEMRWLGYRGHPDSVTTGVYNNAGGWAGSLATYFNFSPNYDYWSSSEISQNTNGFKVKARENLIAGIPILFRYETVIDGGGHAVIIDGVENNDFFHFIFGWGGYMDGYYYLFSNDVDPNYEPRPHIDKWGLNAAFDVVPNCSSVDDISYSNQIVGIQEGFVFDAKENITLSNVLISGNGQDGGRAVAKAGNSVTITSEFEVQLGSQFSIYVEPCGN